MMSAAQRQPVLIGERRQIVRMRRLHDETNDRAALTGGSENTYAGQFGETLDGVAGQLRVVLENSGRARSLRGNQWRLQPDRAGDIGRARLETMRRFLE